MVSWASSRFCTAHGRDPQRDTQTIEPRYVRNNRPHFMQCIAMRPSSNRPTVLRRDDAVVYISPYTRRHQLHASAAATAAVTMVIRRHSHAVAQANSLRVPVVFSVRPNCSLSRLRRQTESFATATRHTVGLLITVSSLYSYNIHLKC